MKPHKARRRSVGAMNIEPAHEHDCSVCHYLGQDVSNQGEPATNAVDLYICAQGYDRQEDYSLIRRYGSEGGNYGCLPLSHAGPRYATAILRARERGLIK
jgi:hypothetical protein